MAKITKKNENIWEISKEGKMNVPGIIFASDELMDKIKKDKTIKQVKNVAMLPGIIEKSIAMPDAHQGYGFPIGGVAAFDIKKGVISPGGVGYDIGCGVRLLTSDIKKEDFLEKREKVLRELYKEIPSGVGNESKFKLDEKELNEVLDKGIGWAVRRNYASKEDIERVEDYGCVSGADSQKVSQKAKARGKKQLGSLGSGNHFLEIQIVEEIFDRNIAKVFGIEKGQVVVLIHSGSRGLGHQVASDYIKKMEKEYGIKGLPDRELIHAPIESELGKEYRGAMAAAANFAFVNRQLMSHKIGKVFKSFFPGSKLSLVYDIAHNIAKFEDHDVNGRKCQVCVHRKGATRSFGPGRKEIPEIYRKTGCPIFIPGSMGTASYVLAGTKKAEELSWGSTAHGAGRLLSRSYAKANISHEKVERELKEKGILIKTGSMKGIVDEAPEVYKDVDEVVKVSNELGIGKIIAKLRPLGVIKG